MTGFDYTGYWFNPAFFTIFGLTIYGFGMCLGDIPTMPEILEGIETEESFDGQYNHEIMTNNVAGYFAMC